MSPARAIVGCSARPRSPTEAWGGRTAVTCPALTMTVADMIAALERAAGPAGERADRLGPRPGGGPDGGQLARPGPCRPGGRLGLTPDPDFDSIIRMHLAGSR